MIRLHRHKLFVWVGSYMLFVELWGRGVMTLYKKRQVVGRLLT
jgi:hypothetical protein